MKESPHYVKGFYADEKEYRDLLAWWIQSHGYKTLEDEMWSLGGYESVEYDALQELGLTLSNYHNVDRGLLLEKDGVIIHPKTEFMDIDTIWDRPRVLAFDSTMGLVDRNRIVWYQFTQLILSACKKMESEVLFAANFVVNFGGMKEMIGWRETLISWMRALEKRAEDFDFMIDWGKQGIYGSRKKSKTEMLGIVGRIN